MSEDNRCGITLMHLCHLGFNKSCTVLIALFLTHCSCFPAFLATVQGCLEQIKHLQLKWCKAIPHKKGKLGGWVSENCVALGKICKWFCSNVPDIWETVEFTEPNKPLQEWNETHLEGWLHVHGLPVMGNKPELFQQVKNMMNDPGGTPPLLKDMGVDKEDITRLCVALFAFQVQVMQTEVIPNELSKDLSLAIKVSDSQIVAKFVPNCSC